MISVCTYKTGEPEESCAQTVSSFGFTPFGRPPQTGSLPLLAISINVNTANQRYDLVKRFVLENNLDLALPMEVNESWVTAL